jgi:hypothetical protein
MAHAMSESTTQSDLEPQLELPIVAMSIVPETVAAPKPKRQKTESELRTDVQELARASKVCILLFRLFFPQPLS